MTNYLSHEPKTEPKTDWSSMPPAMLVDHLESTHHAYLHGELPRIEALAVKVEAAHGDTHPELVEVSRLCAELSADLLPHLAKEERVLFPMIRELSEATGPTNFHCGSLANPISMMMLEHQHCDAILDALHETTGAYEVPDDACGSYRALYDGLAALEADTNLHIHKENDVLFPAVIAMEKRQLQ